MSDKKISEIHQELITAYRNLKAEILVAEILENSTIELTDIDIFNQSTFTRSYRRDVIDFKVDSYSSNTDKLLLNIARNGLYDTLPEGLFHDSVTLKDNLSYSELHQRQKKEEKDARSFFSPIENEFFTQKVFIEKNERKLIDEFANLKTDFLMKFWKLDPGISMEYGTRLLQLLPYVHKISGEIELTALSLEKIIGEKVSIKKKYKTFNENIENTSSKQLGVDFVLEVKETVISYPYWEITIQLFDKKNIDKYISNGITKKIITIFCDYFIPIEIDTKIDIKYSSNEQTFVLNETNSPRMGLTTTI